MNLIKIGAWKEEQGECGYRVWAPLCESVDLVFLDQDEQELGSLPMAQDRRGYFFVKSKKPLSDLYKFRLNKNQLLPDPASRYQPQGPHGASQLIGSEFPWSDQQWKGLPLHDLVIYELHVGTFTESGTFAAVQSHVDRLLDLGVNALEIMPIAQFAGKRNWGYDGVGLFAAQNSYGKQQISPLELKGLIDYCHSRGMAVILDVVYNHMGPEGNYLSHFGPYFHDKYKNPWGDALNFDGAHSDDVRNYFLTNAKQWIEEFHFDGLRLDAVHSIFDGSAKTFLEQLSDLAEDVSQRTGRVIHLIAENDTNDSRLITPTAEGGIGLSAHWADDFHHVVHSALTGETSGYYSDFGKENQLMDVLTRGLVYDGKYSEFHNFTRGRSYYGTSRSRLVYCIQNHDQIGNRKDGERLISLSGADAQKLAASLLFLSGGLPLIFMGEEIGETAPFLYFVDHTDKNLLQAVREGRKKEFASFGWKEEPPDPGAEETFIRSRVDWVKAAQSAQTADFTKLYKKLIALSKWIRQEGFFDEEVKAELVREGVFRITASKDNESIELIISMNKKTEEVTCHSRYELVFDSSSPDRSRSVSQGTLKMEPQSVILLKGPR
ncbi:malto-oligosyltrehalose trehalohydrolase [Bdellovibrio sp. SKB1291214]|uniref:malto-oligosyltrehalose trehalohydrolase n=1 Tax=Bdellovibrio sp. SKB1291214 TaxID=1732569 RepID=UPI001595FD63|nr:malto-oligosyltrehalose trehalohydrolase [Bdellovibrio sp. SKB1291214]UYL09623.1 malto-oligosyltrehalose trehalohydrolase [Bdellovibrio sp. SKB1291214]